MSLQNMEEVELGNVRVSANKVTVFSIANITTGVAVVLYDPVRKIGGMAYVVLPESSLSVETSADTLPAKYADKAIPALIKTFQEQGGQLRGAVVKIVGGAQLFNFGGGAGNMLNVGARNATAIRAALSRHGLGIEKADTGGNKTKSVRFVPATGQLYVRQLGGRDYQL